MVTAQLVLDLLNIRKNRLLLLAQAVLPDSQFQAYRTLFLNELGKSGLERELVKLFDERHRDRNG